MRLQQESIRQLDSTRFSWKLDAFADDFFHFQPYCSFNMNGVPLIMTPTRVAKEKKIRQQNLSGERGQAITVTCCVSAYTKLSFSNIGLSQENDGSATSAWSSTTLYCYRLRVKIHKV
jgi:hypothetical protein